MVGIDLTAELAPILWGMVTLLFACALAIVGLAYAARPRAPTHHLGLGSMHGDQEARHPAGSPADPSRGGAIAA